MYLEQVWLSLATNPARISSFSEFLELFCAKSYISNQPLTRHSFPKPANYWDGPGKFQTQMHPRSLGGNPRNLHFSKSPG